MISYYGTVSFVFLAICFASFIPTELLLPLAGFSEDFHKICSSSGFGPRKPLLRQMNGGEAFTISVEMLDSSLVEIEGDSVPMAVEWAQGLLPLAGFSEPPKPQMNGGEAFTISVEMLDSSLVEIGGDYVPMAAEWAQDIDHCSLLSPCVVVCINFPGGFKCYCPKGLVGDGTKNGSGCYTNSAGTRIQSYSKVMMAKFSGTKGTGDAKSNRRTQDHFNICSLVVFLMVIIFIVFNYGTQIDTGENRRQAERRELFKQNGGDLLRRKLSRRDPQLEIYESQRMDLIANDFLHRIDTIKCNPGEEFHRGSIPPATDAITDPVHVLVVTVNRVPTDKLKDFVDQLLFLSKPHANLVRILGCCLDKPYPVIVYELHGDGSTTLCNFTGRNARLPRETWVRAAAGAAKGLAHLNSNQTTSGLGSICSANIMMNNSFHPKIFYAAGSNLMTPGPGQQSDLYADPNPQNKRRDVYSFGVVLVELLTTGTEISQNIIIDAQAGNLLAILGQNSTSLEGELISEVATLACRCLSPKSDKRPKMKEVSEKLASCMQTA